MSPATNRHSTAVYRLLLLVLVLGLTVSPIEWPGVLPIGRASVSAIERTLVVASIPYWDQDRAFQSFRDHAAAVDLVSLFWYTLDRRGRLQPYRHAEIDRHIIDFAHRRQVKVLALIANLPDETGRSWDWRRVDRVIATKSQRSRFIGQVVKLVQEHGYDGINLDFEELRESQRPAFSALVRELASALHRKKKLLRVAVEALVDSSHTHGKDWRVIAQHADQMAVMAFNEHWDDSQPGPIASVPWVRRVLSYARLLRLPMQKIHLGIPLYGYDWPQQASGRYGSAEGLEYDQVLARQRQHSVVKRFDARSAAPSFAYEQNGQRHTVWYENHRSLRHKLNLAKEFGVGGVSLWRLGGEDPGIWTSLLKLR